MKTAAKLLGTAALGALAWGTLVERQLYAVRSHSIPVLPPGATPVRVLHLSDMHLAPWQNRKMRWVRSLEELAPDLIVSTGDSLGHLEALPMLRHTLERFAGVPGVFVFGSNDYYGPILKNPFKYLLEPSRKSTRERDMNTAALRRYFTDELGWLDINNSAAELTVRDNRFEFLGLNDPHINFDDEAAMLNARDALHSSTQKRSRATAKTKPVATVAASAAPAAAAAAADAAPAATDASTVLGVVHAPYQSVLNALLDQGSEVIFSGHTHGGQVCVPGFGALTTNSDLPRHQAKGLSVWFNRQRAAFLNVSAGLGHSIYAPVRFACRPEVSMITLTAVR